MHIDFQNHTTIAQQQLLYVCTHVTCVTLATLPHVRTATQTARTSKGKSIAPAPAPETTNTNQQQLGNNRCSKHHRCVTMTGSASLQHQCSRQHISLLQTAHMDTCTHGTAGLASTRCVRMKRQVLCCTIVLRQRCVHLWLEDSCCRAHHTTSHVVQLISVCFTCSVRWHAALHP